MKKSLSLVLSAVLLHAFSVAPLAADGPLERSRKTLLAARVKASIAQLGAGKSSVVRIVLHDKTKYHGYITEIGEDSFVVADAKTGATAPIAYPEVKGIKGNNFSTGTKICLGVSIAAAVAAIVAVAARGGDRVQPLGNPQCVHAPCP